MNPKAGKIFCADTKRYRILSNKDVKNYEYTGRTQKVGSVSCAEFRCDGKTFLQPWGDIHLRKPGESNISAKLTTKQVRSIVREVYTKTDKQVTFVSLAQKYGVNPKTIAGIAHGRAWRHVTVPYIKQLKAGNVEVVESCISATNKQTKKFHKLNGSIAKFIVRDHFVNKLTVKVLAKKFCVSERSIQRILKGEAWKEYTVPAITEFSKWK